jgi:hypothetical protein
MSTSSILVPVIKLPAGVIRMTLKAGTHPECPGSCYWHSYNQLVTQLRKIQAYSQWVICVAATGQC